jgi:hypothetical protein
MVSTKGFMQAADLVHQISSILIRFHDPSATAADCWPAVNSLRRVLISKV